MLISELRENTHYGSTVTNLFFFVADIITLKDSTLLYVSDWNKYDKFWSPTYGKAIEQQDLSRNVFASEIWIFTVDLPSHPNWRPFQKYPNMCPKCGYQLQDLTLFSSVVKHCYRCNP